MRYEIVTVVTVAGQPPRERPVARCADREAVGRIYEALRSVYVGALVVRDRQTANRK